MINKNGRVKNKSSALENVSLKSFAGVSLSVVCLFVVLLIAGCSDMRKQPRYDTYEPSTFFSDGRSARPEVAGTIPRGPLAENTPFFTGMKNGQPVTELPIEITDEVLRNGQERFNIYCSVCHDQAGTGNGMVVQRGFPRPISYHTERLREAPVGYFFDVITNGFGRMPSYAKQLSVRERWEVAAYIRALQLSQHAPVKDLKPEQRKELE